MKPKEKKEPLTVKYKLKLGNQFIFLGITTIMACSVFFVGMNVLDYLNKNNQLQETSTVAENEDNINNHTLPKIDVHLTENNQKSLSKSNPNSPQADQEPEIQPIKIGAIPELVYSYKPYSLKESQNLQNIVDEVVTTIYKKDLPLEDLSITLINVNTNEIAGYQQTKLRYPASVVKLFWLTALYGQYYSGVWQDPTLFSNDIIKMIKDSDNEASSRIVDSITQATSGENLSGEEYEDWFYKRTWLNRYFENAGYEGINISQKTYPIPYLKYSLPEGRDKQMRGEGSKPIRNKISTYQASRLMYEIVTNRAFNSEYSQALQTVLYWNLATEPRRNNDPNEGYFNPIKTFFGEKLPTDIEFYSKAGWTSDTRAEVAFIKTKDGKTAYILAVFTENSLYAKNEQIFPEISSLVYQKMRNL